MTEVREGEGDVKEGKGIEESTVEEEFLRQVVCKQITDEGRSSYLFSQGKEFLPLEHLVIPLSICLLKVYRSNAEYYFRPSHETLVFCPWVGSGRSPVYPQFTSKELLHLVLELLT